jgi:hypothetical protein
MIHSVGDDYGDDYRIGRDGRSGALPVFAGLAAFWVLLGVLVWALA